MCLLNIMSFFGQFCLISVLWYSGVCQTINIDYSRCLWSEDLDLDLDYSSRGLWSEVGDLCMIMRSP